MFWIIHVFNVMTTYLEDITWLCTAIAESITRIDGYASKLSLDISEIHRKWLNLFSVTKPNIQSKQVCFYWLSKQSKKQLLFKYLFIRFIDCKNLNAIVKNSDNFILRIIEEFYLIHRISIRSTIQCFTTFNIPDDHHVLIFLSTQRCHVLLVAAKWETLN